MARVLADSVLSRTDQRPVADLYRDSRQAPEQAAQEGLCP